MVGDPEHRWLIHQLDDNIADLGLLAGVAADLVDDVLHNGFDGEQTIVYAKHVEQLVLLTRMVGRLADKVATAYVDRDLAESSTSSDSE